MKISDYGLALIMNAEGYREKAYRCPAGRWTIGYGHTAGVKKGDQITKYQAMEYLKEDLRPCERIATTILQESPSIPGVDRQYQVDALCSFAYNCGCAALKNSSLAKAIKRGAPEAEIRAEFDRWVYADSDLMPGLVLRRQQEADLYYGEAKFTLNSAYEPTPIAE